MAKAVRRIITLPPDWDEAFERAAKKSGESFSEFLRLGGAERLSAADRKKLSEPLKGGRPRNPDETKTQGNER